MTTSSLAARVTLASLVIGDDDTFYTPLDLDKDGNIVLLGAGYYPPFTVVSVDKDREIVVVRHSAHMDETEEQTFLEFGLIEGSNRCLLPTTEAQFVLNELRGPRPTSRNIDWMNGVTHTVLPSRNLLEARA